jgi:tetratricopeptide (TPR) repeat protein
MIFLVAIFILSVSTFRIFSGRNDGILWTLGASLVAIGLILYVLNGQGHAVTLGISLFQATGLWVFLPSKTDGHVEDDQESPRSSHLLKHESNPGAGSSVENSEEEVRKGSDEDVVSKIDEHLRNARELADDAKAGEVSFQEPLDAYEEALEVAQAAVEELPDGGPAVNRVRGQIDNILSEQDRIIAARTAHESATDNLSSARNYRDTAIEHQDAEDYVAAIKAYVNARNAYSAAIEAGDDHDLAAVEVAESELASVEESLTDCRRERTDSLAETATELHEKADQRADAVQQGDATVQEAIDAYAEAMDAYRQLQTYRNEAGIDRPTDVDQKISSVKRDLERTRRGKLRDQLSKASSHREAGDFEAAKSAFSAVIEALETNEFKFVDPGDIRERAERGALRTTLERIEEDLSRAEEALGANTQHRAETLLDEVQRDLDDVESRARVNDLSGILERVTVFRKRSEGLRTDIQAEQQSSQHGPPASVPSSPDLVLSYDEIEKESPIGGGGSADVYEARALTEDDSIVVALKEPRFQGTLQASIIKEFQREAETWGRLDDHAHVVGVVDWGTKPLPWIAMEYMNAGPLGEHIGDFDLEQALWTALGVTRGVRHAHTRGIAHLDLKPANILLRDPNDQETWPVPKVGDWGLARMLLQHSKSVDGFTPQYAAPEQIDDDRGTPDQDTDIYQLGAVFYELFTGQPPFTGGTANVLHDALHEMPPPPSTVNASLPREIDDILLTALEKDRTDRYEDVLYLRDALEDVGSVQIQ